MAISTCDGGLYHKTESHDSHHLSWRHASAARGFSALPLTSIRRTLAISGSRPYANHAAGFYREFAALRGSACAICSHRARLARDTSPVSRLTAITF